MSLCVDIEKKLGACRRRAQLEAQDGATALLGASGCGKSMTLKCIAGIVTPDRGRIVLGGRVLFDSEKKINLPPQQRRVGYLFQQYGLFPNMSVEQNILCGIRSGDKAEKRRVLAEKIRMFRLEGLEKKHPAQLSGGQQQRVALARTLTQSPRIILADEPVAALDPVTAKQVMQDFVHINQEMGISILLNIHHVELALEYADRIIGIVSPDSAPIKRLVQDAREKGALIDASYGRRTQAVLIMDSDHVILSGIPLESLTGRANEETEEKRK